MSETKNELETLLEKAATEPGHRPAFFRTLLESTVWVPGAAAEGEQIVEDSAWICSTGRKTMAPR
jgi:hypothetical protein